MEEAAITQRRTSGTAIATPPTRAGSALTRLDALLRPLESPRRLVFYGLIAGLLCAAIMIVVAPHPFPLMGSRLAALHSATIARMHGDPLLTAAAPHGNGLTAANASDDQGLFLFGPMVGDLLGTSDPTEILIALRAILFGIAAAVLPLALWRLTSSLTVAVAAPFAVTLVVLGMRIYDLYWIGAWAILGLVPMVLAVAGRPRRSTFWVLVIACALAGLATSIRNYAGLPVLLAALFMLLRSPWRWPGRALVAIALCVAYLLIPMGVIRTAVHSRDDRLGSASTAAQASATHLFWHPMYLGLGYLPNRYGITWDDSYGARAALRQDPRAVYPTARYEAVIRRLYVRVLKRDPGFVAEVNAQKLLVAVGFGAPGLMLLALGLPAFLLLHPRRRDYLRWVVALSPAIALGLAQPLVGIPAFVYDAEWLAAVGLLLLLGVGLLAAPVETALRSGTGPRAIARSAVSTIAAARHARLIQALTIAGVIAVVVLWLAAVHVRTEAQQWSVKTTSLSSRTAP
jgi:hypothetical protein